MRQADRLRRQALSSVGVLALLTACGPAWAEEVAKDAQVVALPEIVVTAQKRSENLSVVPASVSFIDGAALSAQGARGLSDYGAYVPGLQIDTAGTPGQSTITLRGIAPVGSGSAVGTYIDDAPLGSSAYSTAANSFQLDLLPYDLKGVEVLRGPQGTLYGASTMGGLLKYDLIKADVDEFHGAVGGDLTTVRSAGKAGAGARGMVNVPIIPGVLAVRASGFYQKTPGYIDNPGRGQEDINDARQSGGRLALRWTPRAAVEVTLDALHQKIDSYGNAVVPLDPTTERPLIGDLKTNIAQDEPFIQKTDFLKGAVNWTLPFATATSVTSYSDTRNRQALDITAAYSPALIEPTLGVPGISGQFLDIKVRKFTQEVRLTSQGEGPIEWMVGGFYTSEKSVNGQAVTSLDLNLQPNALNPLLIATLPSRYKETAAFGNLTWRVTDALSLAGGLRYSHNAQRYLQFTSGVFAPGDGGGSSKENVTTYSASAKYQLTPAAMVYARVASGYQPGGPNVAATGVPPTVGSSTLTNYEAGWKARLLESRLALDVSAFQMDWKDIQVSAVTPPPENTGYLINGGKARSKGIEASATYLPIEHLVLGATFAYTDSKFVGPVPSLGVLDGDRLPHVPRYAASGTAEYRFEVAGDWEARLGGGVRYVGARRSGVSPPLIYTERSYVAVDLNGHLVHDDWKLGVFARNLFDKRAYVTKTPLIGIEVLGSLLQPRTIGVSLDRTF